MYPYGSYGMGMYPMISPMMGYGGGYGGFGGYPMMMSSGIGLNVGLSSYMFGRR
jgi:hypothetical protein